MNISLSFVLRRGIFIVAILFALLARAGDERVVSLRKVGDWPPFGVIHSGPMVIDGDHAFVPSEEGLYIVNVSDPKNPQRLSTIPGFIQGVAVRGDVACVADLYKGFRLFNVSDREHPTLIKDVIGGLGDKIEIAGDIALFTTQWELRVFNVADPAQPIDLGSYHNDPVRELKVAGHLAYISDDYAHLRVVDFTNPTGPTLVGSLDLGALGSLASMAIHGDFLYASVRSGIAIISISDPQNPSVLGQLNQPNRYGSLAVVGDLLFASRTPQEPGFQIFDLSSPTAPLMIHDSEIPTQWFSFGNSRAYLTDSAAQVRILDITSPTSPSLIADFSGSASDVIFDPPYAYLADGRGGLRILDTTDLSHPQQIGSVAGSAQKIALCQSNIFATFSEGGTNYGVRVIDVSDPFHPRLASTLNTPYPPYNIIAQSDFVYLTKPRLPLQIVDVSDPTVPKYVSSYGFEIRSAAVDGSTLYACNDIEGINVVDLSDPLNPTKIGSVKSASDVSAMATTGNLLLCGIAGGHAVEIFDASSRTNMHPIGFYKVRGDSTTEGVQHISVKDEFAFVTFGHDGLDVLNISDPSQPWSAGRYNPDYATSRAIGNLQTVSIKKDSVCLAWSNRRFEKLHVDDLIAERPKQVDVIPMPLSGPLIIPARAVAYVASSDGLGVLDLTHPEQPNLVSTLPSSFFLASASANFLCGFENPGTNRIAVFGLKDPWHPRFLGSFYHPIEDYPWRITQLKVVDHYAFVTIENYLLCFDLGDGSNPTLLWTYTSEGRIYSVAASGNLLCVSSYFGLDVLDWSHGNFPTRLSRFLFDEGCIVSEMSRTKAYCLASYRLVMLDLSDPRNPIPTYSATYPFPSTLWDLPRPPQYANGRLFMPSGGLQVFDATKSQLLWVGGVWNSDSVGNFAIYRNYAYVLNSYGRLYVYRLNSMPHLDMRASSENWTLRWEERFSDYELFQAPSPAGPWEKDSSPVSTGDGYMTRPVNPSEPLYFQLLRAED